MDQAEKTLKEILKHADIKINGKRAWDIKVKDQRFYNRILTDGSLGLGESYMDGWWDSQRIDLMIEKVLRTKIDKKIKKNLQLVIFILKHKLFNIASKKRAFKVGEQHYDLGNELYEAMLDLDMNYSCGYWKHATTLTDAQVAKMDLICKKLYLKKGMKVLDIGSGWGNFARYAAKNYGVEIVGITVSKEQAALARIRCKGLPIKFNVLDYRDFDEKNKFDRIVSIGMFEHVTYKNYDAFMKIAYSSLKDGGMFLLHTIGYDESVVAGEPWEEKYIFPNSHLPSVMQIGKASEKKFVIEDIQNFGFYYYPTLMSWFKNFDKNWKELSKKYPDKYGARFYRMWKYYLLSFAGAFKAGKLQLFQIILSKNPRATVYEAVR